MRKMAKTICVVLSLSLLVNMAGFEALAADSDIQTNTAEESDKAGNEEVGGDKKTENPSEGDDTSKDEEKPEEDVTDKPDSTAAEDGTDENQEEISGPEGEQEKEPENETTGSQLEKEEEEKETISINEKAAVVQSVEGLIAQPVAGTDNKLKISWNAVADAVKYQVKVQKYPDETPVKQYDSVTDTSCTVDVNRGEKYYIEVAAQKAEGDSQTAIGKIPAVLLASPSVTAKAGNTNIKLSWKSVTGTDKYQVVCGNNVKNVSGNSYEATGLKKDTKYNFTVQAISVFSENGKTYTYVSDVAKITVSTTKDKPAKVKKLTGIDGDGSAILTWSKAARAETYVVYRYNASKKKWEVVKNNVKKLTYTDQKLKQGNTYKYRVAASNNGGIGEISPTISVQVKKTPGKVRSIGYKAVIKSRAPLFVTAKSKKRVKYLKAGTKVTTIDYSGGRYKIRLSDGKYYWVALRRLRFTASIWTKKDYSTKAKEDFVNKKGYKSPTKYLIWISHYTQRVIIYRGSKGKWKVVRSGSCATGTHAHMTPKGVFRVISKKKGIFYKYTYEKPAVYFKKGIAFHSRIKRYSGGYSDATIGRPKSHGCVRLYDQDINFIYKKCPKGTTVVSY